MNRVPCRHYFESVSYTSGNRSTVGYKYCCDMHGWCGLSGWYIFLIIVYCLIVLAIGGAAFWFFFLKRKFGGKEEVEERTETNGTEDIQISIETD
uniref:Uncharacterized protein n=1 Tax=Caenorhabditis tropicalis TaxID=1561998 RepID=A0A1I7TGV2_9PELO